MSSGEQGSMGSLIITAIKERPIEELSEFYQGM